MPAPDRCVVRGPAMVRQRFVGWQHGVATSLRPPRAVRVLVLPNRGLGTFGGNKVCNSPRQDHW